MVMVDSDEEAGYNPLEEQLDLTHLEKLRATALMMALKYQSDTIIKDAEMYKEIKRDNLPIKPAHIDSVIDAACSFVTFLMTGANSTQVKAIIAEADEQIEQVDEAIDKAEETINSLD